MPVAPPPSCPRRNPGAAGIAALLLGLLTTPWVYVAFGALWAFPPPFAAVATPLLTAATVHLTWEAFSRKLPRGSARVCAAGLSAAIQLTILWVLTDFTLLTSMERVGLFATTWLGASGVWLFLSLWTGTKGFQAKLSRWLASDPRRLVSLAAAALLFGALAGLAWRYLTTPPAFIG